jgi:hypothetical protein
MKLIPGPSTLLQPTEALHHVLLGLRHDADRQEHAENDEEREKQDHDDSRQKAPKAADP